MNNFQEAIKSAFLGLIVIQLTMGPHAYGAVEKAPPSLRKEFIAVVKAFKNNPSYATAKKTDEALSKLNGKYDFVAAHMTHPFAEEFAAFHAQMKEVVVATESIAQCAGGDPRLNDKVVTIGNAFAQVLSTKRPDTSNKKLLMEVEGLTPRSLCYNHKAGAPMTQKQIDDIKSLHKALVSGSMSRLISDHPTKVNPHAQLIQNKERVTAPIPRLSQDQKNKIRTEAEQLKKKLKNRAEGTLVDIPEIIPDLRYSNELRPLIESKYGFVLDSRAERTEAAKKLHLELMKGNRESNLRNYVYYSQRFDFSGEEDLSNVKGYDLNLHFFDKAQQSFQVQGWDNLNVVGKAELERLGDKAALELQNIRKGYGTKKLTADDTYYRLLPYLKEAGYLDPDAIDVSLKAPATPPVPPANQKALNDSNPASAKLVTHASLMARQARFDRAVIEAEKGEVGFLLQSKGFQELRAKGFTGLNKQQIIEKIKASLVEKVKDTQTYAKDMKRFQGTKNVWGARGDEFYAQIGKELLYSSPLSIYETLSKNPELLGSLCRPLREAAKDKDLALPDHVKFGASAVTMIPGVGNVAGFVASTTIGAVMAAEYRYRKADELERQGDRAGINNLHHTGTDEARRDKKSLRTSAAQQRDQLGNDVVDIAKTNAAAAVGVYGTGKVIKYGKGLATTLEKKFAAAGVKNAEKETVTSLTALADKKARGEILTAAEPNALASEKNAWLKDLDRGVGGPRADGLMTDQAKAAWKDFKLLTSRRTGAKYDQVMDDLFNSHMSDKVINGKVTQKKLRSIVDLKSKLKAHGLTDIEAAYWSKYLPENGILGQFENTVSQQVITDVTALHKSARYADEANLAKNYKLTEDGSNANAVIEKAMAEYKELKTNTELLYAARTNNPAARKAYATAKEDLEMLENYMAFGQKGALKKSLADAKGAWNAETAAAKTETTVVKTETSHSPPQITDPLDLSVPLTKRYLPPPDATTQQVEILADHARHRLDHLRRELDIANEAKNFSRMKTLEDEIMKMRYMIDNSPLLKNQFKLEAANAAAKKAQAEAVAQELARKNLSENLYKNDFSGGYEAYQKAVNEAKNTVGSANVKAAEEARRIRNGLENIDLKEFRRREVETLEKESRRLAASNQAKAPKNWLTNYKPNYSRAEAKDAARTIAEEYNQTNVARLKALEGNNDALVSELAEKQRQLYDRLKSKDLREAYEASLKP